jgi:hypothetical protein
MYSLVVSGEDDERGVWVASSWRNFCKYLRRENPGCPDLRTIVDIELSNFGSKNGPDHIILFETEEDATAFVLRFS